MPYMPRPTAVAFDSTVLPGQTDGDCSRKAGLMMRMKHVVGVCGLAMIATLATGCQTDARPFTVQEMLGNMSPSFETLALSRQQRQIRQARTLDLHGRQLANDLDKIFLTYRPLRLAHYTIP